MKDKKHIDKLFQEQFQDFEATPPPAVWDRIETQLQETKKERRVIPLWWRVAGVAALLALLLTVGLSVFKNNHAPSNEIVTENPNSEQRIDALEDASEENKNFNNKIRSNNTQVASEEKEVHTAETNSNPTNGHKNQTISEKTGNDAVVNTKPQGDTPIKTMKTSVAETNGNTTRNTTTNKKTNKAYNQPQNASNNYNTSKEAVATSNKPKNATQNSSETTQNPLVKDLNKVVSDNEAVAKTTPTEKNTTILNPSEENNIAPTKEIDSNTAVAEISEENKKSIFRRH